MDRLKFSSAKPPRRRSPLSITGVDRQTLVNAVALAYGALLFAWLQTGAAWVLLAVIIVVALGIDQVLRAHPRSPFVRPLDTLTHLFVPVLFGCGAAFFLRDIAGGFVWNAILALLAAGLLALTAHAEYLTVEPATDTYQTARAALSWISCLAAFAIFTTVATAGLRLPVAVLVTGATVLLLTVDLLREMNISFSAIVAYAAGAALVTAEVGWAVYFLALPDYLTGGLILLTYYVITGTMQEFLVGRLDRGLIAQFAVVSVVGLSFLAGATVVSRAL